MSETLVTVQKLILQGEIKISSHGYDELADNGIFLQDILANVHLAKVVEDYPDFVKGPSVLVLQYDRDMKPLHVVWGIPRGYKTPAVLVTATDLIRKNGKMVFSGESNEHP